jgi:hypothetical protein
MAAAVGVATFGPAGAAQAAGTPVAYDFDHDGVPDRWLVDLLYDDGIGDHVIVDPDGTGLHDFWFMDGDENGIAESTWQDTNGDGMPDTQVMLVTGGSDPTINGLLGVGSPAPASGGPVVLVGSGPAWNSPESVGQILVDMASSGCNPWVLPDGWACVPVA